MPRKIRRTMTIDKTIDAILKEHAKASRRSMSRTVNQALNEYVRLDQQSLKSLRRLAGVLEVETWQVLNNLMKKYLQEVEARRTQLAPAALFVDELIQMGGGNAGK